MIYAGLLGLGVALAVPIAALGGGIGQGLAASGALQAMGRQPEAARDLQTNMLIALGIIESLTIYAFVMAIILMGRLPSVMEVLAKAAGH